MDVFYRGLETSLLAISFLLVVTVAALSGSAVSPLGSGVLAVTLPMIDIAAESSDD